MEECKLTAEILAKLAEPFTDDQVSWLPTATLKEGKGDDRKPKRDADGYVTCLAVPYVDARDVAERLDRVVGGDWSFTWTPVTEGSSVKAAVVCGMLTVCGVNRSDAGEYKAGGDMEAWKAAVSDALKRAAVLFGVARYLYRMDGGWFKYDDKRNRWLEPPHAKGVEAPRTPSTQAPQQRTSKPAEAPKATMTLPTVQMRMDTQKPAKGTREYNLLLDLQNHIFGRIKAEATSTTLAVDRQKTYSAIKTAWGITNLYQFPYDLVDANELWEQAIKAWFAAQIGGGA